MGALVLSYPPSRETEFLQEVADAMHEIVETTTSPGAARLYGNAIGFGLSAAAGWFREWRRTSALGAAFVAIIATPGRAVCISILTDVPPTVEDFLPDLPSAMNSGDWAAMLVEGVKDENPQLVRNSLLAWIARTGRAEELNAWARKVRRAGVVPGLVVLAGVEDGPDGLFGAMGVNVLELPR